MGQIRGKIARATRSAPRDALTASSVDKRNRGRAFGLEGVGDNTGAFLGPLLTVFLRYSWHVEIRAVFYLAIIPGLLAFLMVLLVIERPATCCWSSVSPSLAFNKPRQVFAKL